MEISTGEAITVGPDVVVRLVKTRAGGAKLAIKANPNHEIKRLEKMDVG